MIKKIFVELLGTTVAASMFLWMFWAWLDWDLAVYCSWAYTVVGMIAVGLLEE